jgi:hypothetical protein
LFLILFVACTPKSPDLTPREDMLLTVRDWLDYAQDARVTVLTSVKRLHDQGEISDELFQKFRVTGQAIEDAQRAVVLANKAYILATTEDKMSHLFEMLTTLKESVFEIERLWATYGGSD